MLDIYAREVMGHGSLSWLQKGKKRKMAADSDGEDNEASAKYQGASCRYRDVVS